MPEKQMITDNEWSSKHLLWLKNYKGNYPFKLLTSDQNIFQNVYFLDHHDKSWHFKCHSHVQHLWELDKTETHIFPSLSHTFRSTHILCCLPIDIGFCKLWRWYNLYKTHTPIYQTRSTKVPPPFTVTVFIICGPGSSDADSFGIKSMALHLYHQQRSRAVQRG